jgi:hypothetical protein
MLSLFSLISNWGWIIYQLLGFGLQIENTQFLTLFVLLPFGAFGNFVKFRNKTILNG